MSEEGRSDHDVGEKLVKEQRGSEAGRTPGLARSAAMGAGLWGGALLLFGVAEMLVNNVVGLFLPASAWAFSLGVYLAVGLVAGVGGGLAVALWERLGLGPLLDRTALLPAVFAAGFLFVFVGLPLNDRVLPGFFAPVSLLTNGLFFVLCAGFGALAYRAIRAVPAGRRLLGAANLCFWFGLCLSAGMYLDMYVAAAAGGELAVLPLYGLLLLGCVVGYLALGRLVVAGGRGAVVALALAAALGLGASLGGGGGASAAGVAGLPNVLWIVMDTTRFDHLSAYGYGRETSPSLDRLAAEGVVFETAISQSSWTMPSHFEMVTSRYEAGKETTLAPGHRTAAEIFRHEGYATGAVLGNFSLGRRSGFSQGFETVRDGPVMIFFHKFIEKLPVVKLLIRSHLLAPDVAVRWFHRHTFLEGVAARGGDLTDRAISWLDGVGGRPFFLFINYMDPHDAYDPPEPFRSRFAKGVDPIKGFVRWDPDADEPIDSNTFVRDRLPKMKAKDWQDLIDLYDGEIAYLDAQIGRLFDALRERGLYDDTVIVVTADHGELFGEHGLAYHFKALTEEEIHVPLLMRFPSLLPAGERVATPVELNDILPTVVELTGVKNEAVLDGRSLVPLARGRGARPEAETFSYLLRPPDKHFPHTLAGHLFGRRTAVDKYVWSSGGKHEYYDLRTDPRAHHNIYGDRPEVRAAAERVAAWRKRYDLEAAGRHQLDRLTRERLKALGYIK